MNKLSYVSESPDGPWSTYLAQVAVWCPISDRWRAGLRR
jgi:hypothetical protein